MLLSFERPAPAGAAIRPPFNGGCEARSVGRRCLPRAVLENCTEATSAAIDKRRLKNGYHLALPGREVVLGLITVKIVRAHGGCLGTKSR